MRHQQLLVTILLAFADRGCAPLVIKGTALAYTIYREPGLRHRADTDMVFPPGQEQAADSVLREHGFERSISVEGGQASYIIQDRVGQHSIDAHWSVNNSALLDRCFDFGELWQRRTQAPRLGEHAWIPSPVDSLLIACMHRATHAHNPYYVAGEAHHDPDRLIWLLDIDLLARKFEADSWRDFATRALRAQLAAIGLAGLSAARAALGTPIPEAVESELTVARTERPSQYLAAGWFRQQMMDLRASRRPVMTARAILFPPGTYMRARYPNRQGTWLPLLHARRIIGGIFRRIARSVR